MYYLPQVRKLNITFTKKRAFDTHCNMIKTKGMIYNNKIHFYSNKVSIEDIAFFSIFVFCFLLTDSCKTPLAVIEVN